MPRYQYRCSSCEEEREYSHSLKEKMVRCEACGQEALAILPVRSELKRIKLDEKGFRVNEFIEREIEMDKESIKQVKEELSDRVYGEE